jgi:predicted nucleotidyltransferase
VAEGGWPNRGRHEGFIVKQLSPEQRELVSVLAMRLGAVRGIRAVVLGGSHARGRAQPGSDIDLGILYSEVAPFSIQSVRELVEDVNDTAGPMVRDFYEWGPWVNGGAWLSIGGQRVDFVYRNLDQVERSSLRQKLAGTSLITRSSPGE